MRTHIVTNGEVEHEFVQTHGMKPDGFWWAIDDEWYDWITHRLTDRKEITKCYEVILNPDLDILLLDTPGKTEAFTEEFAYDHDDPPEVTSLMHGMFIDWPKVASRYHGIELDPYPPRWSWVDESFGLTEKCLTRWHISWDCASGCVWAPDGYELIERPELLVEWQRQD